jgi:hypothetical protein
MRLQRVTTLKEVEEYDDGMVFVAVGKGWVAHGALYRAALGLVVASVGPLKVTGEAGKFMTNDGLRFDLYVVREDDEPILTEDWVVVSFERDPGGSGFVEVTAACDEDGRFILARWIRDHGGWRLTAAAGRDVAPQYPPFLHHLAPTEPVETEPDAERLYHEACSKLDAKWPRCGLNADWCVNAWHVGPSARPNRESGDMYILDGEERGGWHLVARWYNDEDMGDHDDGTGNDIIVDIASSDDPDGVIAAATAPTVRFAAMYDAMLVQAYRGDPGTPYSMDMPTLRRLLDLVGEEDPVIDAIAKLEGQSVAARAALIGVKPSEVT